MVPTRTRRIRLKLTLAALVLLWVALSSGSWGSPGFRGVFQTGASLWAQAPAEAPQPKVGATGPSGVASEPPRTPSNRRSGQVLLVCGLPGDEPHAQAFAELRGRWIAWLTGPAGFSPQQITIFSGKAPPAESAAADSPRNLPATREQLEKTGREVVERLGADDRLWVLLLGHANYDGERAYFHLPGPDLDDRMLGLLFEKAGCAEQVFWLTNSCAGWFVERLSKPGRIVIAATAAESEYNETEFPAALAAAMERPAAELDRDGDGWVSVADLFATTVDRVTAIFAADERAATEHAQLDDNGDRRGTELPELAAFKPVSVETPNAQAGGLPPAAGNAPGPLAEPLPGTQPGETPAVPRIEDGQQAARTRIYEVSPPTAPLPTNPATSNPDQPTATTRPEEQP